MRTDILVLLIEKLRYIRWSIALKYICNNINQRSVAKEMPVSFVSIGLYQFV